MIYQLICMIKYLLLSDKLILFYFTFYFVKLLSQFTLLNSLYLSLSLSHTHLFSNISINIYLTINWELKLSIFKSFNKVIVFFSFGIQSDFGIVNRNVLEVIDITELITLWFASNLSIMKFLYISFSEIELYYYY